LWGADNCGFSNDNLLFQLAKLHKERNEWKSAARVVRRLADRGTMTQHLNFATFAALVFWHQGDIRQANAVLARAISQNRPETVANGTLAMAKEIRKRLHSDSRSGSMEVSKSYYDDVYRHSKKYESEAGKSIYLPVWEAINDVIDHHGYMRIVDFGCGPGQFAEYILQHHQQIEYTGIDFSEVAISAARKRCPQAIFIEGDLLQSGIFLTWDYDIAILLEVLEHIEKDITLLEKIPRKTLIIASVPNFDAFGHVRIFKGVDDVKKRYEPVVSNLKIKPIHIGESSTIFLLVGRKR
jgi:SAM-dependent methyltransferase